MSRASGKKDRHNLPEAATEIYLLRHGEAEWNADGRFQGKLDSPLTAKGVDQAECRARRLVSVATDVRPVFASLPGRARRTTSAA